MNIEKNYSLKSLNSFGLDIVANEFLSINSEEELIELIKIKDFEVLQWVDAIFHRI